MAFTNTEGRYASFGIATAITSDVIDNFWYVIDNFLKDTFPLKHLIKFELLNNHGLLSLKFSQVGLPTSIVFDFPQQFDPFFPMEVYVIDQAGRETILLPDEYDLF